MGAAGQKCGGLQTEDALERRVHLAHDETSAHSSFNVALINSRQTVCHDEGGARRSGLLSATSIHGELYTGLPVTGNLRRDQRQTLPAEPGRESIGLDNESRALFYRE